MALICAQITPDPMKKYIGLALWIAALIIPFRFAILDTDQVVLEDGEIEHATGGFEVVGKLGLKCEDCGAKVTYGATPKAKPAKTKFKAKAKARR